MDMTAFREAETHLHIVTGVKLFLKEGPTLLDPSGLRLPNTKRGERRPKQKRLGTRRRAGHGDLSPWEPIPLRAAAVGASDRGRELRLDTDGAYLASITPHQRGPP
jgi:hypothetical protein